MLALHGWGRRGSDFGPALAGHDAIALDLPGFGATPPPEEAHGAQGYADLVAPVLDEFDLPPVLVGHSFGGRIAVCLAARWPELVGSVVITGSPLLRLDPPKKPAAIYRVARSLSRLGVISEERMEQVRRRRGSADYRAAAGVMRNVLVRVINEDYAEELSLIRSRVMLLWGGNDREVPVAVAEAALRLIRRSGGAAELEVLPGVGHLVPLEAPEALRRVVGEALQH